MARIRAIKPGFFDNEELAELPPEVRLFFIGLWTIADKAGILEDRPKRIKALIFPYDEFKEIDIIEWLDLLEDRKCINRYTTVNEPLVNRYIHITNWHKHQRPHHTETPSDKPLPDIDLPEDIYLTVKKPLSNRSLTLGVGVKGKGLRVGEGVEGRENEGRESTSLPPDFFKDDPSGDRKWLQSFFEVWDKMKSTQVGRVKFLLRTSKLMLHPDITRDMVKTVYTDPDVFVLDAIWDVEAVLKNQAGIVDGEDEGQPIYTAEEKTKQAQKVLNQWRGDKKLIMVPAEAEKWERDFIAEHEGVV